MDSPSSDCSEANENAAGLTDDTCILLAASQQYEDSIGRSPSYADEYPISPVTEAKYNEMDEEDFMLCNLYCQLAMHAAKMSWTETVKTNHHQRIMPAIVNHHPHNVPVTPKAEEIVQKIDDAVPMSTRKTTQWSIKLWEDWRQHRLATATCSSDIHRFWKVSLTRRKTLQYGQAEEDEN